MEDKTRLQISDFVGLEMAYDIRENGYYKNAHEVSAYLKSQREEITETLKDIDDSYNYLWDLTKANRPIARQLIIIEKLAIDLVHEAIELAEIARKGKLIVEVGDDTDGR